MSMPLRNLTEIAKKTVDEVVGGLKDANVSASKDAGAKLVSTCREFGLTIPEYLTLSIKSGDSEISGYEEALQFLGLPLKDDFERGVVLQAASDTFQVYPGTRAMFPPVIDDMLRWANRQDQLEQVTPILANSRTVAGFEMITTVVNDDSNDRNSYSVAEGARVPVRSIQTTEQSVKFYKHGSGIQHTYEFGRRGSLDVMVPYVNRIGRELERSKLSAAVNVLVSGDGVNAAASVIDQSTYDTPTGTTATAGKLSWEHLLYWLVQRAKAGTPVDTVVGNWDSYFRWLQMFSKPTSNAGQADAKSLQDAGVNLGAIVPGLDLSIRFVVASAAPASKLVGFSSSDTLEELIEGGSQLAESDRSIQNQTVTYIKTENTGYRLAFGDTRSILDYSA